MNIYYKSTSTYLFLRNRLKLNLPSVASLRKWTPVKHVVPGFNQSIIETLTEQARTLYIRGKQCSLIFDGMSIRKELNLDERSDKTVGFQDLGESQRKPLIAKHITSFIIRADFGNYKSIASF